MALAVIPESAWLIGDPEVGSDIVCLVSNRFIQSNLQSTLAYIFIYSEALEA